MSDDHDHHHHPATSGWTLTIAIGLTLGFAVGKALAGWWSGSLALVSDARHMLTDGGALALAGAAAWLASEMLRSDQLERVIAFVLLAVALKTAWNLL
jgi:cobalt-zinc-cadmium efflux system protein